MKENNIKLIFYPHYIFQKYLKYFKSGSENIILASANNYDIQDLLKQANLLITDYSSVFFDFGYMRKCVLYYQFDVDDYIEKHYNFKNGYFEYETMGFGDVIYNEIHMIKSIEQMISNNFQISSTYKDRCNAFFTYTDNHNCERIYNEIIKLLDMENIIC